MMQQIDNVIYAGSHPVLKFADDTAAMSAYNTMQLHKRGERDFFGTMQKAPPVQRKPIRITKNKDTAARFFGPQDKQHIFSNKPNGQR